MPIYTYACTSCGEHVEKRQSFSDAPLTTCETCGGSLRKQIHPVGIVFKGSGWYVTDSRNARNGASSADKDAAADTKKDSTKESKKDSSEPASAPKSETSSTTASAPAKTEPAATPAA